MANALTLLRIVSGILLIPFPAFSIPFFAFYVIGGISDILDGWIARRTGTVSRTGAMLDSVADAVFFLIAAIRILPAIPVPRPVWFIIAAIAAVRVFTMIASRMLRIDPEMHHTDLSRATGLLLFLFPLTLSFIPIAVSYAVLSAIASAAAADEAWRCCKARRLSIESKL